ncbi:hypothetical protein GCM10023334_066490 [Nonomuraea thailandensis]
MLHWMVREYVATRRREIRIEAGREPTDTFIPQEHPPGRGAEADFGEVAIRLRRKLVTWHSVQPATLLLRQGRAPDQCLGRPGSLLRGPRTRVPGPRRLCG